MNDLSEVPIEFAVDGRTILIASVLTDRVENQTVPRTKDCQGWTDFEKFVVQRAQAVFGKWPVILVNPVHNNKDNKFTGYRMTCLCKAICPTDADTIETAIIVWYESKHWGFLRVPKQRIEELPWSAIAQPLEW